MNRRSDLLIKEYYDGASIQALATKYSVSYSTMHNDLKNLNVIFRPRGGNQKVNSKDLHKKALKAVELYTDTEMSVQQILAATSIGMATLYKYLRDKGIPLRNRQPHKRI